MACEPSSQTIPIFVKIEDCYNRLAALSLGVLKVAREKAKRGLFP